MQRVHNCLSFAGTYVGEYFKEQSGITDLPGIAYGIGREEIEHANRTRGELRDFMMNVRNWGITSTVERFAKVCLRYAEGGAIWPGMTVKEAFLVPIYNLSSPVT